MLFDLIRYDLNFEKTYEYVKTILSRGKTLSSTLQRKINFEKGQFFSLLTEDAAVSRIYKFHYAGLYPTGPVREITQNKEIIPEWSTGMRDEFINYLDTQISTLKFNCLFEDILHSPTDPNAKFQYLFKKCGLSYNKEVYCLVTPFDASPELLLESWRKCNSLDHSLCILTKAEFNDVKDKKLSLEKIEEVCKETRMMILGAYDGEGYVFWESKS